jgi:hypothetical protein
LRNIQRQFIRGVNEEWANDRMNPARYLQPSVRHRHAAASLDDSILTEGGHVVSKEKKLKPFKDMPGPKGLPFIGTLPDFIKKDDFKFNKMFEVS